MALRLLWIAGRIMSDRCRRRKSRVNYQLLCEDSSDDDFSSSSKRQKPEKKKTRMSREERNKAKFEKNMNHALEASKGLDTSVIISNKHAEETLEEVKVDEDDISDDGLITDKSYEGSSDSESDCSSIGGEDNLPLLSTRNRKPAARTKKQGKGMPSVVKPVKENFKPINASTTITSTTVPSCVTPDIHTPVSDPYKPVSDPYKPDLDPYKPVSDPLSRPLDPLSINIKTNRTRPYWKPPAKLTESIITDDSSCNSSLYKPVDANFNTIRIGLSRNSKVKPLHPNVKIT